MDTFAVKVLRVLQEYINEKHGGNIRAAQEACGLDPDKSVFYRWLKILDPQGKQAHMPKLDSIGAIMDKLGVQALTPDERTELRLAAHGDPAGGLDNQRIQALERENAELMQYKYKWEAALELSGKKPEAGSQKKGQTA